MTIIDLLFLLFTGESEVLFCERLRGDSITIQRKLLDEEGEPAGNRTGSSCEPLIFVWWRQAHDTAERIQERGRAVFLHSERTLRALIAQRRT